MQQRHQQVGTERERNGETDQCFGHGTASQPLSRGGVQRHQREGAEAEGEEGEIGHGRLPWLMEPEVRRRASNRDTICGRGA